MNLLTSSKRPVAGALAVSAAVLGAALLHPSTPAAAAPGVAPSAGTTGAGANGAPARRDLQRRMQRVVSAGAPGVVVLVGDGSRRWTGARGVADVRTRRPLRAHQRFRVGSITKSFVATVALQLVDEGRLFLSDTVESRLPGLLPYGDRVTLRQLLDHTSGVPEFAIGPREQLYQGRRFTSWTPRRLVALIAGKAQDFPPGTAFSYSNTNYLLAGLMIEQASGRRLGGEIRRRILRPLRLDDTSFPISRASLPAPSVRGYSLDHDDRGRPVAGRLRDLTVYNPSAIWAGGNMVSDLDDITRFYRALLGGRLLSAARLAEMKGDGAPWVAGQRYGLGLHVIQTPCGPIFGHTGGVPGFSTFAFVSEDGRRQAGAMMNAEDAPALAGKRFDLAAQAAVREAFAGAC
jgi:D-alanyl-D-alanine carboxypeptidase